MRTLRRVWLFLVLAGLIMPAASPHAQTGTQTGAQTGAQTGTQTGAQAGTQADDYAPKAPSEEERAAERNAAWEAAVAASVRGPAAVSLRDQATLALPPGMVFIPQAQAARLSRSLGNRPGDTLAGIVTTLSDADGWFVYVNWVPDGYVRDDDAKDLDPDTVLQGLRDATEEGNKDRVARGFPEIEILGWNEPPHYDPATHHLVWSLALKEVGAPDADRVVNYSTRALGRNGYFGVNLVTAQADFTKDRGVASTLLAALSYDDGKRYSDFDSGTDHVAEYGLMALIGVVAAKKLGLIAVALAFGLKFAKVGAVVLGGGALAVRRLFRRKPSA